MTLMSLFTCVHLTLLNLLLISTLCGSSYLYPLGYQPRALLLPRSTALYRKSIMHTPHDPIICHTRGPVLISVRTGVHRHHIVDRSTGPEQK
ncbi:hypothetical protein RSOLAG1IB_01331 [Rhizoctonia solani AG-1 IB]|uniref:Secreted protein n=1 Tax=Thanatephorus cucumeris (strain AG1-IB / isolate 7/3/14) TaxID=1108050 RepID=A0A0B7FB90_THACB|nr:hypothetical protein RSOLAG1IB_01331 [Rhizoctonia solani AG-1 IB]